MSKYRLRPFKIAVIPDKGHISDEDRVRYHILDEAGNIVGRANNEKDGEEKIREIEKNKSN
jgi:hypothetical protein